MSSKIITYNFVSFKKIYFNSELLAKESKLYMVMEKGDSDLHKILSTYKTNLPLYVLMNFWYQMLQSVSYIHQNGKFVKQMILFNL